MTRTITSMARMDTIMIRMHTTMARMDTIMLTTRTSTMRVRTARTDTVRYRKPNRIMEESAMGTTHMAMGTSRTAARMMATLHSSMTSGNLATMARPRTEKDTTMVMVITDRRCSTIRALSLQLHSWTVRLGEQGSK